MMFYIIKGPAYIQQSAYCKSSNKCPGFH